MNYTLPHIVYYSNNDVNTDKFDVLLTDINRRAGLQTYPKYPMFHLCKMEHDAVSYKKLKYFIEAQDIRVLASLIVVVDYFSFKKSGEEAPIQEILRELIVEYPEVKFVFHKTKDTPDSFGNFLGIENVEATIKKEDGEYITETFKVLDEYLHYIHTLDENEPDEKDIIDAVKLLVHCESNLFDASNLRNTIKAYFFSGRDGCQNVKLNYANIQTSRSLNLAYCIEEEKSQNLFNSYALYINGYRVRSINTLTELKTASAINKPKPSIIIRDFDLQFEDKPAEGEEGNEINKIRGFDRTKQTLALDPYWKNLSSVKTYFITQASKNELRLSHPKERSDNGNAGFINDKEKGWGIVGLQKPINGIYALHEIPDIKLVYRSCQDSSEFNIDRINSKGNTGHSTAPFMYHIAESLIDRAQKYYDIEEYMLAAILSREALEVLNGFHKTLMWKACHLHAISENALIMDQIGCNDKILAINTQKRLLDIKNEVARISGKNKANKNVLSQIFNDIRQTCRDREHFESADIALKMMVHETHKFPLLQIIFHCIKDIFKKCRESSVPKKEEEEPKSTVVQEKEEDRSRPQKTPVTQDKEKKIYEKVTELLNINAAKLLNDFGYHFKDFHISILALILVFGFSVSYNCTQHPFFKIGVYISLLGALIAFIRIPMQIVYGLVGTKGELRKLISMLVVVILIFSCTYWFGFFKNAGITYDINSPQVVYHMFDGEPQKEDIAISPEDDAAYRIKIEKFDHGVPDDNGRYYKRISYGYILKNTIQTTLVQEPAAFFDIVTSEFKPCENEDKASLFYYILLFQILISWIFLGVFISLLYQKFRNE